MKTTTMKYICIALLFCAATVMAQDVSLTVTADKNSAQVGEQIVITAALVSNKNLSSLSAPQIPKSDMFDVTGMDQNQSSSSSVNIINGKMTRTSTVNYMFYYGIVPKKTGTINFPALHVSAGGVNCSSQPFTISVGKPAPQQASSDVHASLSLSKRTMVVGEQAIATAQISYKAQAPIQIPNESIGKMIQDIETSMGNGFTVVRLFKQISVESKVVNGENRAVISLRWVVYPVKSGTVTVNPVSMQYITQRRVQQARGGGGSPFDMFDEFINGGQVEQTVHSAMINGITLSVAALPAPPSDFSGAVGNFSLSADLGPKKVAAGEAATLTLTLSGNTRPGSMNDITLPQLSDCSVFDPEKRISSDTSANGISCRKVLKYLIVPKFEGTVRIPSVAWSYYDPDAHAYKTLHTPEQELTVTKGTGKPSMVSATTQEDIKQLGQDIRYIKTGIKIKNQSSEPYTNPVLILLYLLAFGIVGFSLLYKLQSRRYRDNAGLMLRQKAMRTAQRDINKLQKASASLSMDAFLGEITDCIERFILHKFGFSAIGKVLADLKLELVDQGVKEDDAANIVSFMESMDTYRFGGASLDTSEKAAMIRKTHELITELSKTKKGKQS